MFEIHHKEQDTIRIDDVNNPLCQGINRMKLIMKYTKIEGFRDMLNLNYFEGPSSFRKYYESDKKVLANCVVPKEIFYMLGVDMLYLEQVAVLVAMSSMHREMVGKARTIVPSSTYCTIHQATLGAIDSNYFPLPDVFVSPSFACEEAIVLPSYLSKKYKKTIFHIDCPHSVDEAAEKYLAHQLHRCVLNLADFFKIHLKQERIEETIHYANQARKWWLKFQALRPSLKKNILGINLPTIMYGLLIQSKFGLPQTVEIVKKLYKVLKKEVDESNDHTEPVNSPRILWLHMLPLHTASLLMLLKYLNLNIVADEYSQITWDELDPAKPWRSLARKYMQCIAYGSVKKRLKSLAKLIERNAVDAIIELCHPGCKPVSGQSLLVADYLKTQDIPHLSIEADLIDPDNFSIEQIRTRIEAFVEMLNARGI
ncbi:MAG: 2-hydroxyacyl-CoA dehydratase [Candidatus Aminicenantes bacterium]|nr:MAG: 2-hydroxyacyl-CoA dehydratase [Candidatus Aminicenantes bacterium]